MGLLRQGDVVSAGIEFWVIKCWAYGTSQWDDAPAELLGPFANQADAEFVARWLTCTNQPERLSLRAEPDEWMVDGS